MEAKSKGQSTRNKSISPPPPPSAESDLLVGMKSICSFLRMSEATVLKWLREYDDFPVKKNGGYVSSRYKLNIWFQNYLER
jgi:hypothetical protein